jgi:hypothetical protein
MPSQSFPCLLKIFTKIETIHYFVFNGSKLNSLMKTTKAMSSQWPNACLYDQVSRT